MESVELRFDLSPWAEMYISGRGLANWVIDLENHLGALPTLKEGSIHEVFLRECIFAGVRSDLKAKDGPAIDFRFMRDGTTAQVGVQSLVLEGNGSQPEPLEAKERWSADFRQTVWRFGQVEFEERMAKGSKTLVLAVYPLQGK